MPSIQLRFLSAALAAVAVATSGCQPVAPVAGQSGLVIGITDQQRANAMISVHAHARYFPDPDIISLVMPLPEAIQILHDDVGMAADSRRRRAAAKLFAYWIHRFPFQDFDEELEGIAGAAAVHAIQTYLGEFAGALPPPEIIEIGAANILKFLTPNCRWIVKPMKDGGVREWPPPIEWNYEILVPREKTDIARALDPQSWNECSNLFWASYLVTTPSCCPKTTMSNCSFTRDSAGDPQPTYPPKQRGRPYDFVAFYEHLCDDLVVQNQNQCQVCDQPSMSCDVCFKNLLCVRTRYDVTIVSSDQLGAVNRYDVDYHLGTPLFGEMLGTEAYVIDSDQGNLHVREPTSAELTTAGVTTGDWSLVHVDKHMHFQPTEIDSATGEMLISFADELEGEIAEHACCSIPFERWGADTARFLKGWERRLREEILPYRLPIPRELPPVR